MSGPLIVIILASLNLICMIYWASMAWKAWKRERRVSDRIVSFQSNNSWKVVYERDALYVFIPTDQITVTKEDAVITEGIDE